MGKLLVWVALIAAAWLVWRLWTISRRRVERSRAAGRAARGEEDGADGRPRAVAAPEVMMRCAACGVYLPGSEARFGGGKAYCSDAHREQGPAPVRRADDD